MGAASRRVAVRGLDGHVGFRRWRRGRPAHARRLRRLRVGLIDCGVGTKSLSVLGIDRDARRRLICATLEARLEIFRSAGRCEAGRRRAVIRRVGAGFFGAFFVGLSRFGAARGAHDGAEDDVRPGAVE